MINGRPDIVQIIQLAQVNKCPWHSGQHLGDDINSQETMLLGPVDFTSSGIRFCIVTMITF